MKLIVDAPVEEGSELHSLVERHLCSDELASKPATQVKNSPWLPGPHDA